MKRGFYITITDITRYYGKAPFEAGNIVKIIKDKGNGRGRYDMRATLPLVGTVGNVASSTGKMAGGTLGGDRIYNKIGRYAYAQIMFVTDFCVIAKILRPKDVMRTPYLRAYMKKVNKKSAVS